MRSRAVSLARRPALGLESTAPASTWLAPAIGTFVGVLSMGRLTLRSWRAPIDILWAEDGLHALCADRYGFVACLVEPYAGFLHVVPRSLGWIVSWVPIESWPIAANVGAALAVGCLAAIVCRILLTVGYDAESAGWLAAVPVLTPGVGLESVNSYSNLYVPLACYAAVALVAVWHHDDRRLVSRAGILASLAASSLPTALLLVVAWWWMIIRRRLKVRPLLPMLGASGFTAAAQIVAIFGASPRRGYEGSAEATLATVRLAAASVVASVPGTGFGVADAISGPFLRSAEWSLLLLGLLLASCGLATVRLSSRWSHL